MSTQLGRPADPAASHRGPRIHRAWIVAAVTFVALVGAAGFRATPGALIEPLHDEFGWSTGTISFAVSVNLLLFGLTAPFAAALMERFGIRRVVAGALLLVSAGSGLTVFMHDVWQLVLLWGVCVGLGTGSIALGFVATVANRWFVRHRGLVTGILTAGGAAGQLIFLPALAGLAAAHGWRWSALLVSGCALLVVPLVLLLFVEHPADVGLTPYGSASPVLIEPTSGRGAARRAVGALRKAARTPAFWLLAGGFAICGASTNGLIGTHFIPAAHDHGMPQTTAASLLALVGLFDIAGTVLSGWLTDRVDPRALLGCYYALRGVSLMLLPQVFGSSLHPSLLVFVVFYGLDWVATVPPTVVLCREIYGEDGAVVFGWVFAAHQIGAAIVATTSGVMRDHLGNYDMAWYSAGLLCLLAALMSIAIIRPQRRSTG